MKLNLNKEEQNSPGAKKNLLTFYKIIKGKTLLKKTSLSLDLLWLENMTPHISMLWVNKLLKLWKMSLKKLPNLLNTSLWKRNSYKIYARILDTKRYNQCGFEPKLIAMWKRKISSKLSLECMLKDKLTLIFKKFLISWQIEVDLKLSSIESIWKIFKDKWL